MKIKSALLVLICATLATHGLTTEISAPTNDVYVAVGAWRDGLGAVTNEPVRVNDRLVFMTFCNTGTVTLSRPIEPEFGVRVRMHGPEGKEVSRTKLGTRYGSKFESLRSFSDTRTGNEFAEGPFKSNPGLGGGVLLASPQELFKIKTPGIYLLKIEIQMFRVIKGTNHWSRELFRFSPVTLKVEKRPD